MLRLRTCLRYFRDCLFGRRGFVSCMWAWIMVSALFATLIDHLAPVPACQEMPEVALEDVSIRSMTVYRNITEDQWQVKSAFDVTLLARNNNTVAGCFSTFRRMVVYVGFRDQLILQQEVPFEFELKPQSNRSVVVQVEGDQYFPVGRHLVQLLDEYLQTESWVYLQMYFDALVMRNDRKARWIRVGCEVIARTPLKSFQMSGNLLFKSCGPSWW